MTEIEQLKKRISDLEKIVEYFVKTDRYLFQRDIELANGKAIRTGGGLKIGKSATDKIGLYGGTPVARQSAIAAPSGGATIDTQARTAISTIIGVLQTLNLTA